MAARDITVAGAGILGLWQALLLARAGHRITLVDASADPIATSASALAGVMLGPDCEGEASPPVVVDEGHRGLALWRALDPTLPTAGSLVVAAERDRPDLHRFARASVGHRRIDADEIAKLEPALAGRFSEALFFPDESHMPAPDALRLLLARVREAGVEVRFGETVAINDERKSGRVLIDCRGFAARDELPDLRGVRGERFLISTTEVTLSRPVRLLHPRHPLYVVPWREGRFLVGATVIESEDRGGVSVRSALELLGAAYALHPAFGEAEILEASAGLRPAFPDNVPRAIVRSSRHVLVNGAYRHGYLLGPSLAEAVTGWLADGRAHPLLVTEDERRPWSAPADLAKVRP